MSRRMRLPSPALLVAVVALFVALGGTAVAAGVVPLAKRALVADNAKKLEGKTSAALLATADASAKKAASDAAAAAASQPGPASTAAGLVTQKSAPFTLNAGTEQLVTAACDAGSKAVGGGFNNPTNALVLSAGSFPTADGAGWTEDLINLSTSTPGSGTVVATCLK